MEIEFKSSCVEDTLKFAEKFAKSIKTPCVILLSGDLGAGKTHFVKGFAKGLRCKAQVTSPTFTIMNEYEGGRFEIYHFDMYRLSSADEATELGFEEYFDEGSLKGISIVEWAENVEGLIHGDVIKIKIEKLDAENCRVITIKEEKC